KPGFVARAKNAVKNFAESVTKFFRDTRSELEKDVWPGKEDTRKNTTAELVVVLIAAAVLFVLDATFGAILGLLIRGRHKYCSEPEADHRWKTSRMKLCGM